LYGAETCDTSEKLLQIAWQFWNVLLKKNEDD
jgi:hypothetical protein